MSRHYKKAIVNPEQAKQWLARYESGEPLKTIAQIEHFDIRTVKRQVEEAGEARLSREVHESVLRAALEKHFNDFVKLAETLRDVVVVRSPILLGLDQTLLLDGLKQHLPLSPLRKHLDRYQAKFEHFSEIKDLLEETSKNTPKSSVEARKISVSPFLYDTINAPYRLIYSRSQLKAKTDVDRPGTSAPDFTGVDGILETVVTGQ